MAYQGPVVAFDLDDTLFREREFCRSGFRFLCDPARYKVIKDYDGVRPESLQNLTAEMESLLTARQNPFDAFENFFKPLALQKGEIWNLDRHIQVYRNHVPSSLELLPGVKEILDSLQKRGVKMALVTDGRSTTQRIKIKSLGLDKYIAPDMIFISEETGFDKHNREMFASIVRAWPEARCFYYIGDNPLKDFYYPNLLGWKTILVPYDEDNVHPLSEAPSPLHEPAATITDLNDILQIIEGQ